MNKNKSIKKRIFWVLLAVLIVVISVVAVESIIFIIKNNSTNNAIAWDYCAEYEQCSDDFNLVKDYIATEFPNTYDKFLSVSYDGENGYQLFDRDIDEYLILPDNIASSLNTVCINAFPKKYAHFKYVHFSGITIHGETISFSINDGRCALIYSPKKEPTWVDSPKKYTRVEFLEIRDGWYHVIDKDWENTQGNF